MPDRAAGIKICRDEKCGCTLPCPGGLACSDELCDVETDRCTTGETTSSGSGDEHMKCTCGQHCGCNPCTCGLRVITPQVGKVYCNCGPSCKTQIYKYVQNIVCE